MKIIKVASHISQILDSYIDYINSSPVAQLPTGDNVSVFDPIFEDFNYQKTMYSNLFCATNVYCKVEEIVKKENPTMYADLVKEELIMLPFINSVLQPLSGDDKQKEKIITDIYLKLNAPESKSRNVMLIFSGCRNCSGVYSEYWKILNDNGINRCF